MSDRTLAMFVGYTIWVIGAGIAAFALVQDMFILVLFGAAIGVVGGMLGSHGRKLPNPSALPVSPPAT